MKKQILLGFATFGLLTSSLVAAEAPGSARNQQKQDDTEEICEVHPEYSCVQVRKAAENNKQASGRKKTDDSNVARISKDAPITADRK
jgi:hypothetical protein